MVVVVVVVVVIDVNVSGSVVGRFVEVGGSGPGRAISLSS
jgi:hypothetical protein